MDAWLRCEAVRGVFGDEFIVGIDTPEGRRHLFVDSKSLRPGSGDHCWELKVEVFSSPYNGNDKLQRVRLPQATIEGSDFAVVKVSDLLSFE